MIVIAIIIFVVLAAGYLLMINQTKSTFLPDAGEQLLPRGGATKSFRKKRVSFDPNIYPME